MSASKTPFLDEIAARMSALESDHAAMREALEELSDMYGHAWDLVGGGLMMMDGSIPRFETAHAKARSVLAGLKVRVKGE